MGMVRRVRVSMTVQMRSLVFMRMSVYMCAMVARSMRSMVMMVIVVVMVMSVRSLDRLPFSTQYHDGQFAAAECPSVGRLSDTNGVIERFKSQSRDFQDLATLHVGSKVDDDIGDQDARSCRVNVAYRLLASLCTVIM